MELGYLKYYLKKEYYKKINEKIVKYKDSYESSIERQEKWRQKTNYTIRGSPNVRIRIRPQKSTEILFSTI